MVKPIVLRSLPAVKATTSGGTVASLPTVANKLKAGDALGLNPQPMPAGAATGSVDSTINRGRVLPSQPALSGGELGK